MKFELSDFMELDTKALLAVNGGSDCSKSGGYSPSPSPSAGGPSTPHGGGGSGSGSSGGGYCSGASKEAKASSRTMGTCFSSGSTRSQIANRTAR